MSDERKPESLEEVYRWLLDGGWVICKSDYTLRLHDGRFQHKQHSWTTWNSLSYSLPTHLSDVRALIPAEKRETLWQPVWSDNKILCCWWHKSKDIYESTHLPNTPENDGWLKQTRVNGKCVRIEYVPGEVGE